MHEQLKQAALAKALEKLHTLHAVQRDLASAIKNIEQYQRCHSVFAQDPELDSLRKKIEHLHLYETNLDAYQQEVFEACGIDSDLYENMSTNTEAQLMVNYQGGVFNEDEGAYDLDFIDPIELVKCLTKKKD